MSDDLSRDDYLWTAAGEPDPEIARLEALLAPYAHRGTLPPLPARAPRRRALHVVLPIVTAAASLALPTHLNLDGNPEFGQGDGMYQV